MQNATVVEENEVLLRPVVWVDQLHSMQRDQQAPVQTIVMDRTLGSIEGRCIL